MSTHSNKCSAKVFAIGVLGSLLLRALNATLRWETRGLEDDKRYWVHGPARILAFWHGHQLLMPWVYLNSRKSRDAPAMVVLISEHEDGRLVAKVMKFLGISSVAGSSSRSGREALFALIEKLKSGSHVSITPDGPKGPPYQLKPGIIRIAERAGASIYPTAIAAEKSWTFGSWDNMFLPKPFSRAVLMMGDEIAIPSKLDAEQVKHYTALVENALNELGRSAAGYFQKP